MGHLESPFVIIYKRSGDIFTRLPNPTSLPSSFVRSIAFSTDGTYLAVGHSISPFVTIYKRSGDIFTILPNPVILPSSLVSSIAFSTDGTYLAMGNSVSPFVTIYKNLTINVATEFYVEALPATLPYIAYVRALL